jgi:hypothetical protein
MNTCALSSVAVTVRHHLPAVYSQQSKERLMLAQQGEEFPPMLMADRLYWLA